MGGDLPGMPARGRPLRRLLAVCSPGARRGRRVPVAGSRERAGSRSRGSVRGDREEARRGKVGIECRVRESEGKGSEGEAEAEAGEEDERDGVKRAYAIFLEPGRDPGFGSPNPPPSESWFLFRYAHILIPPVLFPGGRRPWIRPAGRCAIVLCHLCQLCNVRHFTQADGHVKEKMREGEKERKTTFSSSSMKPGSLENKPEKRPPPNRGRKSKKPRGNGKGTSPGKEGRKQRPAPREDPGKAAPVGPRPGDPEAISLVAKPRGVWQRGGGMPREPQARDQEREPRGFHPRQPVGRLVGTRPSGKPQPEDL